MAKLLTRIFNGRRPVSARLHCLGRTFVSNPIAQAPGNVVFSGIQPTGSVHLGNYLGPIRTWVDLQKDDSNFCLFMIADMHSLSLPQKPDELRNNIYTMAATLLACGLDPGRCIIFQQCDVKQHMELFCTLSSLTTMQQLARQAQFRDKSAGMPEVPLLLFTYPVLQAADILLYKTTKVPVGDDQLQQIHLARDVCERFNKRYKKVFRYPETMRCSGLSCRIKSLRDPSKKMSKSDPDGKSRIHLLDEPDVILERCKKAVTDSTSRVTFEPDERPGVANLVTIHSIISGLKPEEICDRYSHLNTGQYKLLLADVISEQLNPIRQRIRDYMNNRPLLDEILDLGAERASQVAARTMDEVKAAIGVLRSPNAVKSDNAVVNKVN